MNAPEPYRQFLLNKTALALPEGFEVDASSMNSALKPFQRDIVQWALRRGRGAIFAGTGLGKTLMQLSWADAVAKETDKRVLIETPLAVAQQTCAEAAKFGIASVAYAREQSEVGFLLPVSNYGRIDNFDLSDFGGIVLDESSIIKSHESQTRRRLIELCRHVPYRLCCTATPAPNDYVELGNHAEFLGVMSAKEMLATWFVHDGSIRATNQHNHGSKPVAEWRLKGHAETDYWRWVSTWAVVIRHPRDIGYDEPGYDLPPLIKKQVTVPVDYAPSLDTGTFFPMEANTLSERIAARRSSVIPRVNAAVDIIRDSGGDTDPWIIWCGLNDEQDALEGAFGDRCFSIYGSLDADEKVRRMQAWLNGDRPGLISKVSICGFGMNLQRCNRMMFCGLNDSWEQLYQAIRRCWRFGQSRPVTVYMVASELEGAVVANLEAKEAQAEHMAAAMAEHMRDLTTRMLRGSPVPTITPHVKPMSIPTWLMNQ